MIFSKKLSAGGAQQDAAAYKALSHQTQRILGITVLLSQLPLLLHLPLWITAPAIILVLAKLMSKPQRPFALPPAASIALLFISVTGVFLHYGHLFGRDPCVAFLFLLLSFKYAETRRNYDASLLIVLCAFILLTQFFFRQSLSSSILSIPSMFFVGLSLFALQRENTQTDTRTMVHVTAKLFLQAIPVASLLFVAVPRLSHAPWGGLNSGHATTGLSARMSPGSIASLSKSQEVAFRVEFDAAPPSASQLYWRGPVLTGYDGHDWYIFPGTSETKAQPTAEGRTLEYTVTMSASYQPWLLALDTPAGIPVAAANSKVQIRLNHELQAETIKPIDQPFRYTATSILSDRFTPANYPRSENLLTTSTNPRARAFAQSLRKEHKSDIDIVNALLQWYNQEKFHYTLNPPKLGDHAIDDFLFDSRYGFCEHYAGSFAFMLRAAGIPARIVTGYQGGEMSDGYMIVRQADAHAWTEAYIDNEWRRFDPTAAVSPDRVELGAGEALRDDPSLGFMGKIEIPFVSAIGLKWDAVNFAWQRMIIDFDSNRQEAFWKKLGIEKPSGAIIALGLLAAAALWALIILKPAGFRRRSLQPCEKYWKKLLKKLETRGLIKNPGETPKSFIARAVVSWPQYQQQLNVIVNSYHSGIYSTHAQDRQQHMQSAKQMKVALSQLKRL